MSSAEKRSWVGGWWCWCGEHELEESFLSSAPLVYLASYAVRQENITKDSRGGLHCAGCNNPVFPWAVSIPGELAHE